MDEDLPKKLISESSSTDDFSDAVDDLDLDD